MSSLDPRIRTAIANSVQEGGGYLASSQKDAAQIEKRCRAKMVNEIRRIAPQLSYWGDGRSEQGVVLCPVDSILNLSRNHGPLGVMAAYVDRDEPVLGALFLPKSAEFMIAERGKGTYANNTRVIVDGDDDLTGAIIRCDYTGCGDKRPVGNIIQVLIENDLEWQNFGSPADAFVAVIRGKADGFVSPCMDPLHMGGYIVMEEAKVIVTDSDGKPLTMDSKSVIAARPGIHERLLELIGQAL